MTSHCSDARSSPPDHARWLQKVRLYYESTMPRETLLDFFEDISTLPGRFVVHDDGYRVREMSYQSLSGAARAFASILRDRGVDPGAHVIIWSENSAEWIVAFWGCLLQGVVVVPVDYRASLELLTRIARTVRAR